VSYNDKVVSNIAPTVVGFVNTLGRFTETMNSVYIEGLDYVAGMTKWRSENAGRPADNTYPIMMYERSVVRHTADGAGRRMVTQKVLDPGAGPDSPFQTFKSINGEIDIDFMLVNPDMNELENFEIAYTTEAGQQAQKKFSYQLPTLGVLTFYVKYGLLSSKTISTEGNHFKALAGKVTVKGFYFVATGTAPKITEIRASLRSLETRVQFDGTIVITP
jgi:hypothetical protein